MSNIQLTPERAVNDFLRERKGEVSFESHRNYRYTLKELIQFCEDEGIEYVNDLNGYHLKRYKLRRRESGIKPVTLKNNLSTLRVFLRWCTQAELLEPHVPDLVQLPALDDTDIVSDDVLSVERVENILDYYYKFEYATRSHAIFQLIWHTCFRIGTVRALDLDDYLPRNQQLKIRHRPEEGTPLKNRSAAERRVNLKNEMAEVLDDYISVHRKSATDEYDRKPLFTTSYGNRVSGNSIRKNMYAVTRPCIETGDCPHERETEECRAAQQNKKAFECPSSMSPHPLRRAAITYHLNHRWPKEKLSERANVSVDVLDKHYDARREAERAHTRKEYLDNL